MLASSAPKSSSSPTTNRWVVPSSFFAMKSMSAEIIDLTTRYKAGATVYELADRFRIHRGTVSSLLERQGVPRRGQSLTSSQIAKAIDLYSMGYSLAKIAPEFACNPSTVWLALLKAGMRMKDSHGRER
jgi:hypothetical protein